MRLDDEALDRLVLEAKGGDPRAFGRLFDEYHEPVFRFIANRVNRPSDAEDLTQLVFVKALEALPRYESRGIPFGGWLFRLARNVVIDHIRTHREHVDLDAVARALADLTDEQREAIELRFFAGLSAREAAEAMGKQEGTVRGLQFRAIASLRRSLGLELDVESISSEPAPGLGDR